MFNPLTIFPLLLPLYLVRLAIFGIPTTVLEIGLYLIAATLLIFHNKSRAKLELSAWDIAALLWLIAGTIGVLIAPDLRLALGQYKAFVFDPLLLFYLLRLYPPEVSRMLEVYFYSAVLLSVYCLLAFPLEIGRLHGPFESANYLAFYLAPALLWYGLSWLSGRLSWSWTQGISAALVLIALLASKSYAALAVVILLGLYGLWRSRSTLSIKAGVSVLLAILLAGFLATEAGSQKLATFGSFTERGSTSVRVEVYRVSAGLLGQSPWLGLGLGQFEARYMEQAPLILGEPPMEWVQLHPHNIFLAIWLWSGLLGLFAFLAFIVLFYRSRPGLILGSMLAYFLLHGLVDTPFWKNDLNLLFFMLLGLAIISMTKKSPR